MLVANESFAAFLIVVVVGYMLIDRFLTVRRIVTLGGSAWFLVLFAGRAISMGMGQLYVHVDYLFLFCGFLLALAVCGTYFSGRALYGVGYDRGLETADHEIAGHMVDRLIENPENVANLDGAFIEVEGAINRVRSRELHVENALRDESRRKDDLVAYLAHDLKTPLASAFIEVEGAINRVRSRELHVENALRDESRRKDDLVAYLAHDLKTPLASVVGYLSLLEEAPGLPEELRTRFTGIALDKAHRLDCLIEEFFDITRFDFHDIVLTRGYVDLPLLLAQVADEFYPLLTEQGKHVEVEAPDRRVLPPPHGAGQARRGRGARYPHRAHGWRQDGARVQQRDEERHRLQLRWLHHPHAGRAGRGLRGGEL